MAKQVVPKGQQNPARLDKFPTRGGAKAAAKRPAKVGSGSGEGGSTGKKIGLKKGERLIKEKIGGKTRTGVIGRDAQGKKTFRKTTRAENRKLPK